MPPSALMARLPHLVLAQGAITMKIGDKDEACARAGLAKIQDRLK